MTLFFLQYTVLDFALEQQQQQRILKRENENLIYTSKIEHFCTRIPKETLFIVFSFFA